MHNCPRQLMSPDRLIAFSDGVIAIAITLLVLNLELPANYASLPFKTVLSQCFAKFDTWLISFWIIGGFWIGHHKLFSKIKQIDMAIMWYNLWFLLIITSISWMVSLIEAFPDEPRAVVIFSSGLGLAGVIHFMVYRHATKKGDYREQESQGHTCAMMATPVTAVVAVLLAFSLTPTAGLYIWLFRHLFFRIGNILDKKLCKTS